MKIKLRNNEIVHKVLEYVEQLALRVAGRARWARWRLGGPFKVRLICCGRCVGECGFTSYEEADRFRERFMNMPSDGHDRAAIVTSPN